MPKTCEAGQYVAHYSFGFVDGQIEEPFSLVAGEGYMGRAYSFNNSPVSAEGPIYCYLVWDPGSPAEPRPEKVVLEIRSKCTANGVSYYLTNGLSCDQNPDPGVDEGVLLLTRNGDPTIYIGPFVPQCVALPSSDPGSYAEAKVNFTVTAHPARLTVPGLTPNKYAGNALIGQVLVPTITIGSLQFASPDTISWNVTGSTSPFVAWVGELEEGEFTPFDLGVVQNEPAFYLCHAMEGEAEYSAEVVIRQINNILLPMPHTVEFALSHKAKAPDFSLDYSCAPVIKNGDMMQTWGNGGPNEPGMKFLGIVTTPPEFVNSTCGFWNYVQLVNPYGQRTWVNGFFQQLSEESDFRVDTWFPYMFSDPSLNNPCLCPADGTEGPTNDSPGIEWEEGLLWMRMDHAFQTYVMYTPPDTPAQTSAFPVPLRSVSWFPKGIATKSGGTFIVNDQGTHSNLNTAPVHPQWDGYYIAEDIPWLPE